MSKKSKPFTAKQAQYLCLGISGVILSLGIAITATNFTRHPLSNSDHPGIEGLCYGYITFWGGAIVFFCLFVGGTIKRNKHLGKEMENEKEIENFNQILLKIRKKILEDNRLIGIPFLGWMVLINKLLKEKRIAFQTSNNPQLYKMWWLLALSGVFLLEGSELLFLVFIFYILMPKIFQLSLARSFKSNVKKLPVDSTQTKVD